MAQSGYTPILIYASGTTGNTPSAGNLTSGSSGAELAINYFDGKLFYKDSGGLVQILASKATGTIGGSSNQVQYNSSGILAGSSNFTFDGSTLAAPALTLGAALPVSSGGTGQTTYTDGQLLIGNSTGNTLTKATLSAGSGITITNGAGSITIASTSSMVYPGAGIPNSTGSAWGTSYSTTGTGTVVALATSPSFTTPSLGAATATSINSLTITTSTGTLTIANGKTLTANNSITLSGTDATTMTFPSTSATLARTDASQSFSGTQTFSGNFTGRFDPRVSSTASASSLTPNISSFDQYNFTALAADLTINAPTGTPVDGNKLIIRLLDNGTPRALTWNGTYTAIGVTLPTTTTANKTTYIGCVYNANNTRWDVIAVATQA